jgi:hypothetical protein
VRLPPLAGSDRDAAISGPITAVFLVIGAVFWVVLTVTIFGLGGKETPTLVLVPLGIGLTALILGVVAWADHGASSAPRHGPSLGSVAFGVFWVSLLAWFGALVVTLP